MINRIAQKKLQELASTFKAVAVVGPRQSGKTTLVRASFPDKEYISLENPDNRLFANEDPRGFLQNLPEGAILDEIQNAPVLFSYLQEILDSTTARGLFVMTGSNNLLLQEKITQSLAGRIAYLTLLPFSIDEIGHWDQSDNEWMIKGFFPPIYDQSISPADWYPNYIKTYLERDVRQIKNITNLLLYERFIKIIAGRTGQELNYSEIANEVGASVKTIQSWVGVLVSSFIVFLIPSHHKNYKKTIVKRPKIYFVDPGLACSLLGIRTHSHLEYHPLRGAIFETMVVGELVKKFTNKGIPPPLYFWRDKTGHEIDVLIDWENRLIPIEIKSGKTFRSEWLKNLRYWRKLSGVNEAYVLFGGSQEQVRSDNTSILNWKNMVTF